MPRNPQVLDGEKSYHPTMNLISWREEREQLLNSCTDLGKEREVRALEEFRERNQAEPHLLQWGAIRMHPGFKASFLPPWHPAISRRNWDAQRATQGPELAFTEHFQGQVPC